MHLLFQNRAYSQPRTYFVSRWDNESYLWMCLKLLLCVLLPAVEWKILDLWHLIPLCIEHDPYTHSCTNRRIIFNSKFVLKQQPKNWHASKNIVFKGSIRNGHKNLKKHWKIKFFLTLFFPLNRLAPKFERDILSFDVFKPTLKNLFQTSD